MKKILSIFLFLFLTIQAMAQVDYLEPVRDFSSYKGELGEYYHNAFTLLNTGFNARPHARFSVLPSFSPEYALSVETKNGKYYLLSNTLSQSCWQADKDRIKVISRSVAIDKPLYQWMGELFLLVTSQIQDLDGSTAGLDGSTYYFASTSGNGKIALGEKWSPNRGTRMERLVQVCESAYLLSTGKQIAESAICSEAAALIKDLRNRAKATPDEFKQPKYAGLFQTGVQVGRGNQQEIEEEPRFPEIQPEAYAVSRLTYPATLLETSVKGYALCQFTINKEGKVVDPLILKYSHPEFAKEALKIVKGMPQWVPAMIDNKPVECTYVLYVPFRPWIYKERVKKEIQGKRIKT